MKKFISLFLALLLVASLTVCASAASEKISVYLEDSEIEFDVPPQTINGRTMVPIRAIFEAMGATVTWDDNTQTAVCVKDGTTVKMAVNSTTEYINDVAHEMDVAPVVIYDRTLAPARYVAEAFEYCVNWDEKENAVLISKPLALSDTVLYSDDNVKVSYSGVDDPGTGMNMFRLTLNIENNYEKNVLAYLEECYINDTKANVFGGNSDLDGIKPGKKASCRFLLTYEPSEISKVEDINKLEFKIKLRGTDFDELFTTETITLSKK